MKQCTITHEGETCIVVWLRMPPINNLFLFLVHTEQGGAVEPITVPVAIPLDENKCCFLPEFNGEALAQLESQGIAISKGDTVKGKSAATGELDELPVYTIDLTQIKECEELLTIIPQKVLDQYQESCLRQCVIDLLLGVVIKDLEQELREQGKELTEEDALILTQEIMREITPEEINELFEDTTDMKDILKVVEDFLTHKNMYEEEEIPQISKEVQAIPQSPKEVQNASTFDNPAKTWESLANKISKQFN